MKAVTGEAKKQYLMLKKQKKLEENRQAQARRLLSRYEASGRKSQAKKIRLRKRNSEQRLKKVKRHLRDFRQAVPRQPLDPPPLNEVRETIAEPFRLTPRPNNSIIEPDPKGRYGLTKQQDPSLDPFQRIFSFQVDSPLDPTFWRSLEESLPEDYSLIDTELVSALHDPDINPKEPPKIEAAQLTDYLIQSTLDEAVWEPVLKHLPSSYSIPDTCFVKVLAEGY